MAWLPLESNPEVINKYMQNLGIPKQYQVVDVYGLDSELLATVPKPVLALLLLFPCTDRNAENKEQQEADIKKSGQVISGNVFYIKQIVANACGTIALVHSVANNLDKIELDDGHLKQFIEKTKGMSPEERGVLLGSAECIINAHKEVIMDGQTEAPNTNEPANYHFVAFVMRDGDLYELDGTKSFPINHGRTSEKTFLEDAARVCKQYMENDPDELRFTVVALTADELLNNSAN